MSERSPFSDAGNDTAPALGAHQSAAEDADTAVATAAMQEQQVAYQAALAATTKVVQPSLLEFLR